MHLTKGAPWSTFFEESIVLRSRVQICKRMERKYFPIIVIIIIIIIIVIVLF